MGSESDIEIVHGDGTVTDKRDGVRRPYADHVAHVRGPSPVSLPGDGAPAPDLPASMRSKVLRAASLTVGAGAVASVLVHFFRW